MAKGVLMNITEVCQCADIEGNSEDISISANV